MGGERAAESNHRNISNGGVCWPCSYGGDRKFYLGWDSLYWEENYNGFTACIQAERLLGMKRSKLKEYIMISRPCIDLQCLALVFRRSGRIAGTTKQTDRRIDRQPSLLVCAGSNV
ncbi:Choline transport protein [Fusarium oxysporum f. sp. albedinis]|nr:Choline transport protein [Fusarium oxysporum f. sp. albedinis]